MNGSISINSDELMEAVSIVDEGLNVLEGSMTSSIASDFSALIDTGLFANGIANLSKQIQSLSTSSGNLITKFMSHTQEFEELESQIEGIANDYASVYRPTTTGGGGESSYDVATPNVENVNQGNSVTNGDLNTTISSIDTDTQVKLVEFLNVNKDKDTSLASLIFNSSKAGLLLTLLKNFYKDVDTSKITSNDASNIQKVLLKALSSNDTLMSKISDNTIISAKKYLESIAKENNTTFEELVLNDKYDELLMESVRNVYDGKDLSKYNVDSTVVNSIRTVVDTVAEAKGVSSDVVITSKEYLSVLKG